MKKELNKEDREEGNKIRVNIEGRNEGRKIVLTEWSEETRKRKKRKTKEEKERKMSQFEERKGVKQHEIMKILEKGKEKKQRRDEIKM